MQTRMVLVVLFSVIVVGTQFSRVSLVFGQKQGDSHDQADPDCRPECKDNATSLDKALSIIGYVGSAFVMVSAWVRVNKMVDYGQESLAKDRWFMAFLGIMTQAYVAWAGYSFKKCYCDASVYMIISCTIGAVISGSYGLMGLVRGIGRVIQPVDSRVVFAFAFVVLGSITFSRCIRTGSNGYYIMILTLVAQVCRIMGTDYTQLSGWQWIVSFVGLVSGFLCIRHPHHLLAEPFRATSMVLGVIRGLEFFWWAVLFVRSWSRTQVMAVLSVRSSWSRTLVIGLK